ncbi:ABC transporter permease [Lactobacillus acetotolerans]|jgi:simple sugar transport system permease protein|uniref:ABC transporter permease n=1 Tax=Lactobacillus acetotolerans TaxID=1600 RepID=A0A0D6A5N1_9LACO|nr:ABC transporter permease [Lactobacillus acetotolerans]KRN41788.1 ABC superfamily ATP binding cassette transporter, membrane protein [Lactobacillus acetotolerans DSM 20749 = JCM 3825]QFG51938.1 ABC transporter permease [Lactobacillus acetotolerans]QJD72873.1 ABC transporter permease [Lactobacillus acetotolerans]BAQ58024.1 ABC transporter permease component [Lactobacillus acetotolerans]GGV09968.1 sugar ABC transporter permease [Lactobacillus acetotolerans DSM 20749 = JCM 3825]
MIKVSPKIKRILVPIISIIAGFLVGAIIMLIWNYNPIQAYSSMFASALGNMNGIGETIREASPLIFTAIGFAIASKAGFFNIGLPGQAQAGWLTSIWIVLAYPNMPKIILLPLAIIVGTIAGALVAGVAGYLRAQFGTNEVITTIMLNYIVLYTCQYLMQQVMSPNLRIDTDTTKNISSNGSLKINWLTNMFGGSRINAGIFLALVAIIIYWFLMKKTTMGFEIKSVGANPFASRYAGMSSKKNIILSMLLSGSFAGLGGVVQGLGTYQNYFTQTTSLDIGWDGLSVALLGGSTTIGILLAAILFSILKIGGLGMQTIAGIPYEIVSIVIAAIIFFVAISYVIGLLFKTKDKKNNYQQPQRKERGPNNGIDGSNIEVGKKGQI